MVEAFISTYKQISPPIEPKFTLRQAIVEVVEISEILSE
jgi:hypothetical protein